MSDDRRERFAAAIQRRVVPEYTLASILPEVYEAADAAMAVADDEHNSLVGWVNAAEHAARLIASDNARLRAGVSAALAVLDEWYGTSDASALSAAIRTALAGEIDD